MNTLKELKAQAHKKIDVFWQNNIYTRDEVYGYLRIRFKRNFHISNATEDELKQLLAKNLMGQ